ncbi:NADP-binding protein [Dacryopinax primogenitus]|uniref:NADP-binding protein n=1 Tax=Dacryopinax primogenitus (strain DJM 731) TaxID=1858805 RepID=M5G4L6_DACPD|nr:NADP-binding protein [Dacryopinax primogenitus]EJU03170.1 NADP-binding protein [Dacryopinax primogenitus]
MAASKVWFITGAFSGFGRIMTNLVLESGNKCVATSIDPAALDPLVKQYGPSKILSLYVDVTKPAQVQEAFRKAKETFGGVDVVFSNAGICFADEVEDTADETARKIFEVNFWGVSNVMKETVKMFRDGNPPGRGGKLMQMASIAGVIGWPSLGYYCASKHAVEGLTKTLVQELKTEWNIQVTLVEPGFFATPIITNINQNKVEAKATYAGGAADTNRTAMEDPSIAGDPTKAMQLVKKVAEMEKLPLHLPIGADAIPVFRGTSEELTKAANDWEVEATATRFDS